MLPTLYLSLWDDVDFMNKPLAIKYNWSDFDNTSQLTSYQKHRIKKQCAKAVRKTIQEAINQSVEDRADRRSELDAHWLDIGGEG